MQALWSLKALLSPSPKPAGVARSLNPEPGAEGVQQHTLWLPACTRLAA